MVRTCPRWFDGWSDGSSSSAGATGGCTGSSTAGASSLGLEVLRCMVSLIMSKQARPAKQLPTAKVRGTSMSHRKPPNSGPKVRPAAKLEMTIPCWWESMHTKWTHARAHTTERARAGTLLPYRAKMKRTTSSLCSRCC